MIEAMVAIVVLCFGLLAIAGFQTRVLASSAGAIFGDQAARLASDMAERIRANPDAAASMPMYYQDRAQWGAPTAAATDCSRDLCNTWELAAYDTWYWKSAVALALPKGDARILSDKGQLRVVVEWQNNAEAVTAGPDLGCEADMACVRLIVAVPAS